MIFLADKSCSANFCMLDDNYIPYNDHSDYNKMISDFIAKQILILGPDITRAVVKKVGGIELDESGVVTKLEGEAEAMLQKLIADFSELSAHNVRQAINDIQRNTL